VSLATYYPKVDAKNAFLLLSFFFLPSFLLSFFLSFLFFGGLAGLLLAPTISEGAVEG
jgi:hypothetical protein